MADPLPFFKFFPSDWLSDERLRLCSRAARGTWQDMLCLMWKAERRGYLELSRGLPLTSAQLARVVGCKPREIEEDLSELKSAGVFSVDEETGVIFSRRLVRDSQHREASSKGGSAVSDSKAKAAKENGTKGGRPKSAENNPSENPTNNPSETQVGKPKEPNPQKVRSSEVQNTIPGPVGPKDDENQPFTKPGEVQAAPEKREPNILLETLATIAGGTVAEVPKSRWSATQKCLREIKEVTPNLTPGEIKRRATNYRSHFRDAAITPEALLKHWATCDSGRSDSLFSQPIRSQT